MSVPRISSFLALLIFAACLAAAESDELNGAIEDAIKDPDMSFQLDVFCTDAQNRRSLTVFNGAVSVWNGERQVRLHADDRRALLEKLLEAGFSGFEARYGERKKADKQEAPLRAICRVSIMIAGVEKASTQLLDGERSADLYRLANALLDLIEPRAMDGIVATSLEDGLVKLASGSLAPELLELRLLQLPEDRSLTTGLIVRVRGGRISRQPYAPGDFVGDIDSQRLDECTVRELARILTIAKVWDLPRNLHHDGTAELELSVLGSRNYLSARSSFRNAEGGTRARFEWMIERIESLLADSNNLSCPHND